MPRRKSAKTPSTKTPPSVSPPPPFSSQRKRRLPSTTASTPGARDTVSRQSKRIKSSSASTATPNRNASSNGKVTPKRSVYFEASGEEEQEEDGEDVDEEDDEGGKTSGYEDADDGTSATTSRGPSDDDSEDDYASSRPKKKQLPVQRQGRGAKLSTSIVESDGTASTSKKGDGISREKELWRAGVKTGLGPGKAVFIEKPKPRPEGGIKYAPDRIHPNTIAFLTDLKRNNDREWMKLHDVDYRTSWKDWETFVTSLTEKIIEKDDTIPELPPKDLVFRVYRDIRFSPDPTPYKPYFSAAWSRSGRKGPYAAYYVQIGPDGGGFIGCGLWMPEAAPLALLRRAVDTRPQKLKQVLTRPGIRKEVFGGVANEEKKCVKAFVSQNEQNALKTKPKGYDADHADIELLRLRNYTIGTKLKDKEVLGVGFLERVGDLIGAMVPMVTYLNSVVMPDDDDDDDDDDDGEEDDGEDDEPDED